MQPRETAPAARSVEAITTGDGWRLAVEVLAPPSPRGVVLLGHAMMVNRRTMDRPRGAGLASRLAAHGLAVVLPDLRGHGESGPSAREGGRWSYDELVSEDTPALVAFARRRFAGLPLCLAGHSLFGHVAAAYAARSDTPPEALVLLASNVWMRRLEPSLPRWFLKRLVLEGMLLVSRAFGYAAARTLGYGSDDEAMDYVEQFVGWGRKNRWQSRYGDDYLARLPRYTGRTLAIVGAADWLNCRPLCAEAFAKRLGGTVELRVVGRQSGLPFDPGHMALTTDARSAPLWDDLARWIVRALGGDGHAGEP